MTRAERLALGAFVLGELARHGYAPEPLEFLRTSDPEALSLTGDGVEQLARNVRERILREHADQVVLNTCPKCGGLAATPKAMQCCWCFYDWHPRDPAP